MKLIKETETNGKIELDGTSFSDMMSIPVVLTAKYEDQEAKKSFVVKVKYECGASMVSKGQSLKFDAFIGLPMKF